MALFCKPCAEKFGMIPDEPQFLFESYRKKVVKKDSTMKVVFKKLRLKNHE